MRQKRRKTATTLLDASKEGDEFKDEGGRGLKAIILNTSPLELAEEVVQTVWESMKEEFHASIEQLPLSFQRTFSLISEQDKEAQAYYAELLPTIRLYVKLRQSLQENSKGIISPPHNNFMKQKSGSEGTYKPPSNIGMKQDIAVSEADRRSSIDSTMAYRQFLDSDSTSSPRRTSRFRDATVPKSVPFPPRQKPRSTKELLLRISFLLSEILRASEEKVGLANAAHDSIIRHLKILDAALIEHDGPTFAVDLPDDMPAGHTIEVCDAPKDEQGSDEEDGLLEMTERDNKPPRRPKRRRRDRESQENQSGPTSSNQISGGTSVDLTEERYCYCNQISYGEMVACDNPTCEHEWPSDSSISDALA
ncbi:hypothetical protein Clacol_006273 [Clathrus columnatus]|uniref:Inhibitor of growth protein N-terminal histone-binding domain-containing protein n=1 Tax=Clathrus columnatus TaxID=1419009 RepID=A0AAV5AET5_9AGAM|nr:hypothetical protein Clacol_006273 [Clathrus columnatus]